MFFVWICVIPVSLVLLVKFLYSIQHGKCTSKCKLDGKLAIVTGASAGIGRETALDLAMRGARVIMACRNIDKAQKVADDIIRSTSNQAVEVRQLDTSSLTSVRAFAAEIVRTEKELHILVNNAGIGGQKEKEITSDGLELTMATNHYGHFLLTNLLGKLLKAGAPSRIVCVSSVLHVFIRTIDPEDLNFRKEAYNIRRVYCLSKLCNVLMVRELAKRLKGTGVTSYSLHPGVVNTKIFYKGTSFDNWLLGWLAVLMGKDAKAGAQTSIYCAVEESLATQSGLYYEDCQIKEASELGRNDGMASKIWMSSELEVNLQDHEANI